jgi:hypothetical protein
LKIVGPCCTLHSGRWTLGSKLCHDLHCCHELCHHHRHQQHTTSRCGSRCCYLHTTETEEFTVPVSFSVMRPPSPQYETMSSVVTIHATPTWDAGVGATTHRLYCNEDASNEQRRLYWEHKVGGAYQHSSKRTDGWGARDDGASQWEPHIGAGCCITKLASWCYL